MFNSIDVEAIFDGSIASTIALSSWLPSGGTQNSARETSKDLANETSSNMIKTHPYAHPQHMEVAKHFISV